MNNTPQDERVSAFVAKELIYVTKKLTSPRGVVGIVRYEGQVIRPLLKKVLVAYDDEAGVQHIVSLRPERLEKRGSNGK